MTYFTPEYLAYLQSPEWKALRVRKFAQVGRRCQKCRRWWHQLRPGEWLEVHHLHYRHLFHEALRDLQVLCNTCHAKETRRMRRNRSVRRFLRV